MTDQQCYALPVSRIITQIPGPTEADPPEQQLAHVSCWQLTDEEREEVARTGKVYVRILGASLSPMIISGYNPIHVCGDQVLTEDQIKWLKTGQHLNPHTIEE